MLVPDIRWDTPANCILAGPSFSGKSTILDKILRNKNSLFKEGAEKKVILFYLSEQPIYQAWERDNLLAYKSKGTPSITKFLEIIKFYAPSGALLFFDDLAGEVVKHMKFYRELFLVHTHHLNLCTFLILHNIFTPGLRELSLNAHRIILTYNPRDSLGVSNLSRQSFPGTKNFLPAIYQKLGETPYSYLCLNYHQNIEPILRVSSNWFGEKSPFVMVFQEAGECSSLPFKCLHLISDDIYQNLIGRQGCEDKCGGNNREVTNTGATNNIENNYYGPDDGSQRGGHQPSPPPHPPSPSDTDLEGTSHTLPPSDPPDPPPRPMPPYSENDQSPASSPPDDVPPPPSARGEGDPSNKPDDVARDVRRRIVGDKTGLRRAAYKARQKRRGRKKGERPLPPSQGVAEDAPIRVPSPQGHPEGQESSHQQPSHPTQDASSVQQPHSPQPPRPQPHQPRPAFKKDRGKIDKPRDQKDEKKLKVKDSQMRVRTVADLSSDDDEPIVMKARSPSPQSTIPKPILKMMPSKIKVRKDEVKQVKSDDAPKLKKITPNPEWISLNDSMDEDLPEEGVVVDREMMDLTPDLRFTDFEFKRGGEGLETGPRKGKGIRQKLIRVRKDLFKKAGEMTQPRRKTETGAAVKKGAVKKPKIKPRIRVRNDLYEGGRVRSDNNERNIHNKINVRNDIFKKTSKSSGGRSEKNIYSRINVRRDLFKKKPEHPGMEEAEITPEVMDLAPETGEAEERTDPLDDSVEYIDLPEIPVFPPPINYNVKTERVEKPRVRRAKLVVKRTGHDVKSVSSLGKRKTNLMGKKIPPKMLKLNVGEKRKAGVTDKSDKKQKKNHQSFIKLWNISKME